MKKTSSITSFEGKAFLKRGYVKALTILYYQYISYGQVGLVVSYIMITLSPIYNKGDSFVQSYHLVLCIECIVIGGFLLKEIYYSSTLYHSKGLELLFFVILKGLSYFSLCYAIKGNWFITALRTNLFEGSYYLITLWWYIYGVECISNGVKVEVIEVNVLNGG